MKKIEFIGDEDPLDILKLCDGCYEQPPGGPLVGYAGRYGPDKKQYVGRVYVNFAKGECKGRVLMHFARDLVSMFKDDVFATADGFCAAPEGGKALGAVLAALLYKDYIFPEKEVVELKTETSREKSRMVWGRHEPEPNGRYLIVEDVCNNFSTTEDLILLIESREAHVDGIVCFLNRSPEFVDAYTTKTGRAYPIYSCVRKRIEEYRQEDPAVAADVAAGNVVWKPKNDWKPLAEAMKRAAENTQWYNLKTQ